MNRRHFIIALVAFTLALLIWSPWRSRFGYHFSFPLPQTAKLVNYHHSWGRDSGDEFVFAVTDDALRDAIIKEWNLEPSTAEDDSEVMSFAKSTGAPWCLGSPTSSSSSDTDESTKPPATIGACGSIARAAGFMRSTATGESAPPADNSPLERTEALNSLIIERCRHGLKARVTEAVARHRGNPKLDVRNSKQIQSTKCEGSKRGLSLKHLS